MLLPANEWPIGNEMRKGPQTMSKTIHGKVRGRTIELDDDLGVPEDDRILNEIYQDRKRDTRREVPE